MDALERKRLEERTLEQVEMVLTEGDQTYLRSLSRADLLEVLETELKFLGLYRHSDTESPVVIHTLLEENLDQWREYYLGQKEDSTPGEQESNPETKVQIEASPLIQTPSSAGAGVLSDKIMTQVVASTP